MLPLLPIVIASAMQGSRRGPLMLALGLTLSFAVIGVGITAFGHRLGVDMDSVNRAAAIAMVAFGIVLLVPRAQEVLSLATAPLANRANVSIDQVQEGGQGASAQLLVGALLGAVWSPCIGPTLGGAISLAASGDGLVEAVFVMLAFGVGVSTLIVALSYGSREVLARRRERLMRAMPYAKPVMGVALVLVGVAILTRFNHVIDAWLLDNMPTWLLDLSVSV